jgi:hypothetical protein
VKLVTSPPSSSPLSIQSEILNISKSYRSPPPVMGIVFIIMYYTEFESIFFLTSTYIITLLQFDASVLDINKSEYNQT